MDTDDSTFFAKNDKGTNSRGLDGSIFPSLRSSICASSFYRFSESILEI